MKKILLLAALFALLPLFNSTAQHVVGSDVDEQFNINATILSAMTLTVEEDLNFGDVFQNTTQHIFPNSSASSANTSTVSAAKIRINGAAGRQVNMTFTNIGTISDGTNNLAVDYVAADAVYEAGNPAAPNAGPTWNPSTGAGVEDLDASGVGTVFLGGSISPVSPTHPAGSYTGIGTLTVYYTGL